LFLDDSIYDEDLNIKRQFDPDCAIAQSWQRLILGDDIKPHDMTLLKHEVYEMQIKKEHPEMKHYQAHVLATQKYNYPKEADEYYASLKKHRKK